MDNISGFKRSPSKVWFGNDSQEYRECSTSSPGSQDSGFSDTENHSHKIANDIFKNLSSNNLNLSKNYKEKTTPNKTKISATSYVSKTPPLSSIRRIQTVTTLSEPTRNSKTRYIKYSPKVSRSLFITKHNESLQECDEPNQYAEDNTKSSSGSTQRTIGYQRETTDCRNTSSDSSYDDNTSSCSDNITSSKSLPIVVFGSDKNPSEKIDLENQKNHHSAPVILYNSYESTTSFNTSLSSDNESELECLFNGNLESPKHTSTPKICEDFEKMRQHNRKEPQNLLQKNLFLMKFQQQEIRVPPIHSECVSIFDENPAVQKWLNENRYNCDQECMTTLQCKSIIGELQAKVTQMAACTTTMLRGILSHSKCIQMEFEKLNSEQKHIEPLLQSLSCNILDYLKTHTQSIDSKTLKLYDEIRATSNPLLALKMIPNLYSTWQLTHTQILQKEIKILVDKLEDPSSEVDLRATVTGITSTCLRNTQLIETFVKCDIIPILLILCDKCEGSTLRTLLLRALSTMCCNTAAIRQFEKFSGLQLISDTIEEFSRPEPERSEAVALLAQITAPWLDDNCCIKGLQDFSRKLVKSLTKFAENTQCCQNLLLCAAALANLSSMEARTVAKHMLQCSTVPVLLEAIKNRGEMVSVYLYEQLATLLANISAVEAARTQLIEAENNCDITGALLYFLNVNKGLSMNVEDGVVRRLQQKCMIALSRFCGDKTAAKQVVSCNGVEKLVKICREKEQRFDSDAVLVAALATLRKIADACGIEVLSAQDAQELVEPKLLDSFLAYSTQNESYV